MTPGGFFPSLAQLLASGARGIAYFGIIAGRTVAQIALDILRAFPRANPLDAQSVVFRVRQSMQAAEEFGALPPGEQLPLEDIPVSPLLENPLPGTPTPDLEFTFTVEITRQDGTKQYITVRIYGPEGIGADELRALAAQRAFGFVETDTTKYRIPADTVPNITAITPQQVWRRG